MSEGSAASVRPDDPVRRLMSTPVAWVAPELPLTELAATLGDEGVGAVPVIGADGLEGVVSERDVVRALAGGKDPTEVWAAEVMAEPAVWVDPEDPIVVVAERMLDEGVRHLPVVSEGQVVGMVSVRDALRVLADAWRGLATAAAAGPPRRR